MNEKKQERLLIQWRETEGFWLSRSSSPFSRYLALVFGAKEKEKREGLSVRGRFSSSVYLLAHLALNRHRLLADFRVTGWNLKLETMVFVYTCVVK